MTELSRRATGLYRGDGAIPVQSLGSRTRAQTTAARLIDARTEADPMSLARPESLWCSGPKRSTVASIAEFSSSTITTRNRVLTLYQE